eukprot:763676-Prorocentrum_minimum.AAC.3
MVGISICERGGTARSCVTPKGFCPLFGVEQKVKFWFVPVLYFLYQVAFRCRFAILVHATVGALHRRFSTPSSLRKGALIKFDSRRRENVATSRLN